MTNQIPTPASSLLPPNNHTMKINDHEGPMAYATHSIPMMKLKAHLTFIAGGSKIFNILTITLIVAEETYSGSVFSEINEVDLQETSNYIERRIMNP